MVDENNAYSFTTSATQKITLGLGTEGFKMWRGGRLAEVTLAYETWGKLSASADNAIIIFTGHDRAWQGDRHRSFFRGLRQFARRLSWQHRADLDKSR